MARAEGQTMHVVSAPVLEGWTCLSDENTFRFLRPRCDRVVAAVLARIL
jgi:hypothetical protein